MENCSSHGCNCCPPWWVTMGFVPPLQSKNVNVNTGGTPGPTPIQDQPPVNYGPPRPGDPGYQPPVLVGPRGEAIPPRPLPTPPAFNPIDFLNPITGPLNPFGGLLKGLFGIG